MVAMTVAAFNYFITHEPKGLPLSTRSCLMANTVLKEYILREMINNSDENTLFG